MFERVVDLIAAQLPVNKETITRESRLIDDLGADSASIMIIAMDMENEMNLIIEDDALSKIRTVGDIVDYIEEHVEK
ncbi:MAG: acyl carrier protein [Clostridia bacterium]|nr:acyl carrier protein [Clostridia bacterium]